MSLIKWFWAVVCYHGWWKRHPRDWEEIKQNYGKLTQRLVHFDALVEKNRKRGTPIHAIRCKICGDKWFTTCKVDLCKRIGCWFKYYGGKNV